MSFLLRDSLTFFISVVIYADCGIQNYTSRNALKNGKIKEANCNNLIHRHSVNYYFKIV